MKSSSSSRSSSSSPSAELTLSEKAFKATLYPILSTNCAICHNRGGAAQPPFHSDSDLVTAHGAALKLVNLDNPESSRFVSRLRDDKHNCGTSCAAASTAVKNAIQEWSRFLKEGSVAPAACSPKFAQDLVLLGDLPFINSITALLGDFTVEGKDRPDAATKLFSQKSTVANTSLLNARLDWAVYATDNFQRRAAQISGCFSADKACAKTYIEKTAHRAFKRPVSSIEVNDLMAVFDQGAKTNFAYGLKLAVQAIIISPSFNHRTEYGVKNNQGTFSLTAHEFAGLLAFLLTDTLPDQELLAAADSGALNTTAERERQALRLLSLDSTKASVESTLMAAWNIGNIFGKVKDTDTYPKYSSLLASQMYEETRLFLREHLWRGGINNVLNSRTTYINGALADLYGIAFPGSDRNQFERVTIDDGHRAGLMTQASLLTTNSRTDETSVVARGLFVNGPLLCLPDVPPPPEEAVAAAAEQIKANATEAELAEFRGKTQPCLNCHNQFDAYGLMFENYDAIGQYRAKNDKGEDIHASVDLSKIAAFDGVINGPVEFAELLTERPEFVQCVTRHLFAYGTGNDGINSKQCEVTNITDPLSEESTLVYIIKGIVNSPALSTRISEAK